MRATPIAVFSSILLSISLSLAPQASGESWPPVSPEDLALKQGRIDKDADAEAIDWKIEISDYWAGESVRSTESQYRRVKIFNARGRDALSRIDIPYRKGTQLTDVAARTIRPDGSVIVVKKDAIMDRIIVKGRGLKERVKTIAIPGAEPGSIVECRWTTVRFDQITNYMRINLQLDIPVEQIRFSIRPLPMPTSEFKMQIRAFNFHLPPFEDDPSGFKVITLPGIRGFKREPYAPPEMSLLPWVAIYYIQEDEPAAAEFWRRYGREAHVQSNALYRASGDVKEATRKALEGVSDPSLIVERLVEYCRTQIRNSDLSDSGLTAADRKWLESEHSAEDYFNRRLANSYGVLKVFLSMAAAAGLDARLAFLPDRSECVFTTAEATPYLLSRNCAAVNVLGAWRAVDPTAADLEPGLLPWEIQGVDMLIPDPKEPAFVRTPVGTPEQSLRRRTAQLKLSDDGTVEGEVTDQLTGQDAAVWRRDLRDHSEVEREKKVADDVKENLSAAEVSAIHFDPGSVSAEPFRISYHIRVPAYAQRTSQRLFLQPAFFQRGEAQSFTATKRDTPIFFDYAWSETDMVTIELPPGFHLESPPESTPIVLPGVGRHSVQTRHTEDGRHIQFLHSIIFGENGTIAFPTEEYPKLKKAFEDFHTQDQMALSIVADETRPR